jgi:hypothetical protein
MHLDDPLTEGGQERQSGPFGDHRIGAPARDQTARFPVPVAGFLHQLVQGRPRLGCQTYVSRRVPALRALKVTGVRSDEGLDHREQFLSVHERQSTVRL